MSYSSSKVPPGPGYVELTLGLFLSLLLGVVLGAVHLVTKPVERLKELPKEPVPGKVYYLEGTNSTAKSRQWLRKRQMLTEGVAGELLFNEDELNAWVSGAAPKKPAGKAKTDSPPWLEAELPNFRIRDDQLQIGIPVKLSWDATLNLPLVLQVRGHFEKTDGPFVFVAKELYCGALPLHRFKGLPDYVMHKVFAGQDIPPELMTTWGKLSLVAVEGSNLRLVVP